MKRTRHSADQTIDKLREADAMVARDKTVAQVVQRLGVSEQTFHRWRNQFGGMKSEEAKRLIANQAMDIAILKEANDYLGKPRAPQGGGRS